MRSGSQRCLIFEIRAFDLVEQAETYVEAVSCGEPDHFVIAVYGRCNTAILGKTRGVVELGGGRKLVHQNRSRTVKAEL